jgi:hypothetical protein
VPEIRCGLVLGTERGFNASIGASSWAKALDRSAHPGFFTMPAALPTVLDFLITYFNSVQPGRAHEAVSA